MHGTTSETPEASLFIPEDCPQAYGRQVHFRYMQKMDFYTSGRFGIKIAVCVCVSVW